MSAMSGPSSSGTVSSNRLREFASAGYLPLRVQVRTPQSIVRPTVGLRVSNDNSMRTIFQRALAFNDRFLKSEKDIIGLLSQLTAHRLSEVEALGVAGLLSARRYCVFFQDEGAT